MSQSNDRMLGQDDAFRERCRKVMRECFKKWQWELVTDEESFLDDLTMYMTQHAQQGEAPATDSAIEGGVQRCYNPIWYSACCGDGKQKERGWKEVEHYVARLASAQKVDEAAVAELTQIINTKIWVGRAKLKEPAKFLFWVRSIALNSFRDDVPRSKKQRWMVPLEDDHEASWVDPALQTAAPVLAIGNEREQLLKAMAHCLQRSAERIRVIEGLFFEGKTTNELATELGKEPDQIYQLRFKALKQLRSCEALLSLLKAWIAP